MIRVFLATFAIVMTFSALFMGFLNPNEFWIALIVDILILLSGLFAMEDRGQLV